MQEPSRIAVVFVMLLMVLMNRGLSNVETEAWNYSKDVSVELAIVCDDGEEKNGIIQYFIHADSKPVREIEIRIYEYDADGNLLPVREDTISISFGRNYVDPLQRNFHLYPLQSEEARYLKAVVSRLVFLDGKRWTFNDLAKWQARFGDPGQSRLKVSVEEANLRRAGERHYQEAEKESQVALTLTRQTLNPSMPGRGMILDLENLSGKKVDSVYALVAMYNLKEEAIDIRPYGPKYLFPNIRFVNMETKGLPEDQWQFYHEYLLTENTAHFRGIILEVHFADGSFITNYNFLYWLLHHRDHYQS